MKQAECARSEGLVSCRRGLSRLRTSRQCAQWVERESRAKRGARLLRKQRGEEAVSWNCRVERMSPSVQRSSAREKEQSARKTRSFICGGQIYSNLAAISRAQAPQSWNRLRVTCRSPRQRSRTLTARKRDSGPSLNLAWTSTIQSTSMARISVVSSRCQLMNRSPGTNSSWRLLMWANISPAKGSTSRGTVRLRAGRWSLAWSLGTGRSLPWRLLEGSWARLVRSSPKVRLVLGARVLDLSASILEWDSWRLSLSLFLNYYI